MRVYNDIDDLCDFEAWGPAVRIKNQICDADLGEEFMAVLEDIYPEGITDVQLNDILAYDSDEALSMVGLTDDIDEDY